jgi:hypothetical protein
VTSIVNYLFLGLNRGWSSPLSLFLVYRIFYSDSFKKINKWKEGGGGGIHVGIGNKNDLQFYTVVELGDTTFRI